MKYLALLSLFIGVISYGQRSDFSHITFTKADSIALVYKGESLKNLSVLTHKLTVNLSSDVEKFRAIYTWVSTNIENDYSAYIKVKKTRKKLSKDPQALTQWNTGFTPKVFKKLLNQRKTACTGYAYLIREMASLASIDCTIIGGYGRTATLSLKSNSIPNHSWNAVKLDNKWYLCDATWSAGQVIFEDNRPIFKSEYYDGYFLADPALFIKNHYPLEQDWILLPTAPTFTAFIEGPIIYKEAFKSNIIPVTPIKMQLEAIKNQPLVFNLATPEAMTSNNIVLVLATGSSSKSVTPKIIRNTTGYTLEHSFARSGTYDIHIKVDDTIVATYVARIRRK